MRGEVGVAGEERLVCVSYWYKWTASLTDDLRESLNSHVGVW